MSGSCNRSPARLKVAFTCRCAGPKPLTRFTTRDWPSCPSPSTRRNSSASITSGIIGRWRWRLCCCWWNSSSRNANEPRPARHTKDAKPKQIPSGPASSSSSLATAAQPATSVLQPQSRLSSGVFCVFRGSCFGPRRASASPSSALREYKAGQYDRRSRNTSGCSKRRPTTPASISTPAPPPTATGNSTKPPSNSTPPWLHRI